MTRFGISGIDDKQDLHRGRPHGGVAIMWHKSLAYSAYNGYNWLTALPLADSTGTVFSGRQLRYVRYMLSQIRLSVCRLSVTLVHPTQAVAIFGNFFPPYDSSGTLVF